MRPAKPAALASALVLSCRLAIATTGAVWLLQANNPGFYVAAVSLLLTFVPSCFVRDVGLRNIAGPLIALLLAAHIVLGMYMGLYETSRFYDKMMHIIGSGAIAVILMGAIRFYCGKAHVKLPDVLLLLLVFSGTLTAGTLWEIFEFAVDRTGWFVAQRGLQDTMLDLLADTLGAGLALGMFACINRLNAV